MTGFLQRLYLVLRHPSEAGLVAILFQKLEFARAEKEILRSRLPKPFRATPQERNRLIKLGKPLGAEIKDVITIVTPRTFARWLQGQAQGRKRPTGRPGRPRTAQLIRQLICKLARENGWGYTRMVGELLKLGVKVSHGTVVNVLREHGVDPAPRRGKGSWHEFIRSHAQTLWACDFFTQPVLTWRGWVDYYFILFIHIQTRQLFVSPATANPTGPWTTQQARNLLMHVQDQGLPLTHLIRDNDSKFACLFDATLESAGAQVVPTAVRAPNMNAYAERAGQTLQVECLDHFLVIGEKHLNYLIQEFVAHYHEERPHQSLGNQPVTPLAAPPPPEVGLGSLREVACRQRLGGRLKHYYRCAA